MLEGVEVPSGIEEDELLLTVQPIDHPPVADGADQSEILGPSPQRSGWRRRAGSTSWVPG
jgi:hypothetical protein